MSEEDEEIGLQQQQQQQQDTLICWSIKTLFSVDQFRYDIHTMKIT